MQRSDLESVLSNWKRMRCQLTCIDLVNCLLLQCTSEYT